LKNMLYWISLLLFLSFTSAQAGINFRESYKGPRQIALSGGGIGDVSGLNSVFINPAGLVIERGAEFYFGTTDISKGIPPLLIIGKRANETSSYAFTFFRTENKGPDSIFQGIMGSFAINSGRYFSIGAEVFTKILDGKYTVDLNSGIQYSLGNKFRIGLRVNNISESDIGHKEDNIMLERSYGAGLTADPFHKLRIYYDLISPEMDFEKASHTGAYKITFGNVNSFSVFNSFRVNTFKDAELFTGIGLVFKTRISKNRIGFSYSLGGLPINHSNSDIIQAVSVNWSINLFQDSKKPYAFVSDRYGYITPSKDTLTREAYFKLEAGDDDSPVSTWHFVICDVNEYGEAKQILRSFSGKGLPPKFIKWGGRDSFQNLVPKGFYTYRLIVQDKQGNLTKTRWQLIEMRE